MALVTSKVRAPDRTPAWPESAMITVPALTAEALGSFLAADMHRRFGSSHARLTELVPSLARLALECIGNW